MLLATLGSVDAATVTVASVNFRFEPANRTVNAGDVVRWTFAGDPHTVTSGAPGAPDGRFDSGIKDPGGSFQVTFDSAGSFPYFCQIHPEEMFGTIVVRAGPAPTPEADPQAHAEADAQTNAKADPEADASADGHPDGGTDRLADGCRRPPPRRLSPTPTPRDPRRASAPSSASPSQPRRRHRRAPSAVASATPDAGPSPDPMALPAGWIPSRSSRSGSSWACW